MIEIKCTRLLAQKSIVFLLSRQRLLKIFSLSRKPLLYHTWQVPSKNKWFFSGSGMACCLSSFFSLSLFTAFFLSLLLSILIYIYLGMPLQLFLFYNLKLFTIYIHNLILPKLLFSFLISFPKTPANVRTTISYANKQRQD